MASTSLKVGMDNFNGKKWELWKLKMEDMLIDQDLWDTIFGTKPQTIGQYVWDMIDKKYKGLIRFYLADSILLNVHEEKIAKDFFKKLRDVYQAKSLVNKYFRRKINIFFEDRRWRICC